VREPTWVLKAAVEAMHDAQLVEHGGAAGLRDAGLLESALARAPNLMVYGDGDLPALAAAYAFGITRDHPFIDGNKRTAFLAAYVFLRVNGLRLEADEVAATNHVLALASGDATEAEFAGWLRAHVSEC
jgi:death-on-curing protein